MKLKNTSQFPIKEIRRLIRVAKGSISLKGVRVHIKNANTTSYRGMCY